DKGESGRGRPNSCYIGQRREQLGFADWTKRDGTAVGSSSRGTCDNHKRQTSHCCSDYLSDSFRWSSDAGHEESLPKPAIGPCQEWRVAGPPCRRTRNADPL